MNNLSISLLAFTALLLVGGQFSEATDLDGKELVDSSHCQQKGGKMKWTSGQFFTKKLECDLITYHSIGNNDARR